MKFGNVEVKDLTSIRTSLSTYTTAIAMSLRFLSLGSQGRIERRLSQNGGDLEDIRQSVNLIVAKMAARSPHGSVMTNYTNDDRRFWRALRRKVVKDGCSSTVIRSHKNLIKDYVKELGDRGVFDDPKGQSCISLLAYDGVDAHSSCQEVT